MGDMSLKKYGDEYRVGKGVVWREGEMKRSRGTEINKISYFYFFF